MHGLDFLLFGLLTSTARALFSLKRSELLYRENDEQDTLDGNSDTRFGLQKIRKTAQDLPPILKADKTKLPGSVPLSNDGHDTSYIVEAKVGLKMQKLNLLLDSGAPNSWVMKSDCQTDACKMHSTFDSNKPTSGSIKVSYGTGNVHGDYINETIAIGGLNVNFTFGSVLSASQEFMNYPIDGILGIGYAKANQNPPSFMQSVIADKILDQNVIGINLFRHNEKKDGEVVFGGVDKSRISGDITYSEVVDDAYDWRIPFEGFSVDDNSVNYDKKVALVDTGTSYILAPKNDVAKLHGYVNGSKKVTDKTIQASYTVPCDTKSKLQLSFSGTNFTVSPKDYIGVPSTKDGPDCYSNIVEQSVFGDDVWLMGDTLIKNIYVVFDWDKSRIGMAERNFDEDEPISTTTSTPTSASTSTLTDSTASVVSQDIASNMAPSVTRMSTTADDYSAKSTSQSSMANGLHPASFIFAISWALIIILMV